MSEDVKQDNPAEEVETTQEVADDASDGERETDNEPDYRAELERLKDIDRKKSGALKEERERRRRAEDSANRQPDLDDGRISEIVKEALEEDKKRRTVDYYEDRLEEDCPDESYRELVRYHYENTIRTTGESRRAIERDIARAKLLANEAKFMSEAQQKAQRSVAEREAYIKDGKKIRSETREDTAQRGTFVAHDGSEIRPQNAAERKLLESLGLKKG